MQNYVKIVFGGQTVSLRIGSVNGFQVKIWNQRVVLKNGNKDHRSTLNP